MSRIVNFFINSNIFVAFSAFCLYKVSELLFNYDNSVIGLFVFFSTLLAYCYMKLPIFKNTYMYSKSCDSVDYHKSNYFFFFFSLLFVIFLSFSLGLKFIKLLIPPILISIIYPLTISINSKVYGVRSIPFLKIFLISFTWSYVTLMLPNFYYKIPLDYFVFSSFFERFCFILAVAIPFDIRDYSYDRIRTIPNEIGVNNSKIFSWFCLFLMQVSFIINAIHGNLTVAIFFALFISIEICSVFIYLTNTARSSYFYSILVESLPIIMYFLVLIASML